MARQYGINAQLLGAFETVFNTPPGGDWRRLPFVSWGLGMEQGLIESDLLGLGRDPRDPARDVKNVDGPGVVPVEARDLGFWLTLMLGPPLTTGVGPFTHAFASGLATLPTASLEIGHPQVPRYFVHSGVAGAAIELAFQRSGLAQASLELVGKSETQAASSGGGTPTQQPLTRFHQFQGAIRRNGVALGNVVRATARYDNGLDRVEVIAADGEIAAAEPTAARGTGQVVARFADTTLLDDATGGAAIALELVYANGADSLTWSWNRAFLPKPKVPVEGPGGIEATFDYQAAFDDLAGEMLTVVLVNDVAGYP